MLKDMKNRERYGVSLGNYWDNNKISECELLGNSKKNLMKEIKKRLNARLECHLAVPHALPY